MFGLKNRHMLSGAVGDEFERLFVSLRQFLSVEHTEDGRHTLGLWQPYPALFFAEVTPATIGNGRLHGRFTRIGDTVAWSLQVIIGSTTSVGSGPFYFSLPVPVAVPPVAAGEPIVVGYAYTTNGIAAALVQVGLSDKVWLDDHIGLYSDVHPAPWTPGFHMHLTGTYEAAPERDFRRKR